MVEFDESGNEGEAGETARASRGGHARAANLSAEDRTAIARTASIARWSRNRDAEVLATAPRATHGGVLSLVPGVELPCYVLEDERRLVAQKALISSLGISRGAVGDRLKSFASGLRLKPFISNSLADGINNPIIFRAPRGGIVYGYEATVLADICDAVLAARAAGALQKQQMRVAEQCEVLVRSFARVGIIALVDEATGYQAVRAKDALARVLEKFIAKELRPWVRTFPPEFYEEMFRLNGWQYPLDHDAPTKRPMMAAKITDDVVYRRLAPGVRDELHRLTARDDRGRLKTKLFQRLNAEFGHPKLREHLSVVMALMKISDDMKQFRRHIDRVLPRFDKNYELPLND